MNRIETLALASGLVCAFAPLAQAVRIGATRSARDVSLIWLALYGAGSAIWLAYGIAIDSVPLVASQATALICVGLALTAAVRYRRDALPLWRRNGDQIPVPTRRARSRGAARDGERRVSHRPSVR